MTERKSFNSSLNDRYLFYSNQECMFELINQTISIEKVYHLQDMTTHRISLIDRLYYHPTYTFDRTQY